MVTGTKINDKEKGRENAIGRKVKGLIRRKIKGEDWRVKKNE